ncbi:MAG: hypothetical protein OQK82_00015, partial [Candidatus Pacearchaeota archaeon]|nr:hypothetical protein [Candidatus Pacearchaeota archaeon]
FKADNGRQMQGCKITVAVPADLSTGNKLGFDAIKVSADFGIFKTLEAKGTKFPTDLNCTVESRASGDKLTDFIVQVKLPEAAKAQGAKQ